MERFKALDVYSKIVLILMLVLPVVFLPFYIKTISRDGFSYRDAILTVRQEHGATVYSGKIGGETAEFTVSEDGEVLFRHGSKTYGPYTFRGQENWDGVDIYDGNTLLFRGRYEFDGEMYWLYNEDGTVHSFGGYWYGDGQEWNSDGTPYDPVKPTVYDILSLAKGPKLTHKGTWLGWFAGLFFCAVNAGSVLFADELFYLRLSFRVSNAYDAEPSELELVGRRFGWAAMAVWALIVFAVGLR